MRVPMVRREQKVVQPFTKDDLTTLLAACNPKTYVGSRMRAMILFLLDTGVRSSELVSIELCDVLFDEGRVRVLNGKGRKQRWTAISEVALTTLRTYLEDFRGWSAGQLFQTFDDRALRNHHMNVMFTRHGVKAGVRQVNPHRFRHTFATWAIRVNARELDVQYLLGHSSPMMVRLSKPARQAAVGQKRLRRVSRFCLPIGFERLRVGIDPEHQDRPRVAAGEVDRPEGLLRHRRLGTDGGDVCPWSEGVSRRFDCLTQVGGREREAGQVTRGIGWSDGWCLSRCYLQSAGWRWAGRRRLSASGRVVIAAGAS